MDDLTEEQLIELRANLDAVIDEVERELAATREGSKPVDLDQPIGRLSRMDALQQQQMTKAHRRRLELRLQQARAAVGRFEREEYGDCLLCDEPIGIKRLAARPESPMCLTCQSERES